MSDLQNPNLSLQQAIAVIPEPAPRKPKATQKSSNCQRDRPSRMSQDLEEETNWIAKIKEIVILVDNMNYQDIITLEPGKRSGKPCIRGMRITVYDVLSYLASGMTTEEILSDFPYLTRDDILACLSYAADREQKTLTIVA